MYQFGSASATTKSASSPTVLNGSGRTTHTVIFLHGLGGSGSAYESLVRPVAPMFPHVKFILPSAPVKKMTFNGMTMPSWYDIHGFSPEFPEDDVGVNEAKQIVHDLIDKEIAAGVPSNQIVLAGASQGGAVALYSGLTYNKPLAGILALSTYLPLNKDIPKLIQEANKKTPILMCHGEEDNVVPYMYGKQSYELLKTLHNNINLKSYKDMGHTANFLEIMDIVAFMNSVLNQNGKVDTKQPIVK